MLGECPKVQRSRHAHAREDLRLLHLDAVAAAAAALDDVAVGRCARAAAVVAEDHLVELKL